MSRIEPKTTLPLETIEPLPSHKLREPRRKLRVRSGIRAGDGYVEPIAFKINYQDA
jgi:hypothetical protein